jgi:hypothetical protein
MRDKIRLVMQYAGPRMIHRHPLLAFYHFIDGMRRQPGKPTRNSEVKVRGKARDGEHAEIR